MTGRPLFRSSIYYALEDWGKLIRYGISPFLIKAAPYYKSYFIFLSNYRGQHVKLIFELNGDAENEFNILFKEYFADFIVNNVSDTPIQEFFPGKKLWMNYENNTFEIDNFKTHFLIQEKLFLEFNGHVSKLIIYQLSIAEIITFNELLDLGLYLLVKLSSVIPACDLIESLDFARNSIIRTSDLSIHHDLVKEVLEDSASIVENNHAIINEYAKDMLSKDTANDMFEILLIDWLTICSEIISRSKNRISLMQSIQKMLNLMTTQLGFNESSKLYLLNIVLSYHRVFREP
jgi:hypothetical protein